jgi:DDE superfamily endonuclease/Uncharacterized conserved protein (DUF2173)
MWCVGTLTQEYRERMYDLLELYTRPFRSKEPVVCVDEKSKQFLKDSRTPLPIKPDIPLRLDYEYVRAGTCNLFVAVEPRGGRRTVLVTDHRAKTDFVAFVRHLLEQVYATAHRVHLVMDNLNTHFRKCFEQVLGIKQAQALLHRVVFHYTPKHASWLNMAEIEIGILDRQCLDQRLGRSSTILSDEIMVHLARFAHWYRRMVSGNTDLLSLFSQMRGWAPSQGWIVMGKSSGMGNSVLLKQNDEGSLNEVALALQDAAHW